MRVAEHGEPDAQHSLTLYAVVDKVTPRLAWLSMRPITGRTHQLRAHCEAIGHPIVGDPKYNRRPANDPARSDPLRAVPPGLEPKLHLLARRLILPHPRGGMIDVTAPLAGAYEKASPCSASTRANVTRSRTRPMSEPSPDPLQHAGARTRYAPRRRTCGPAGPALLQGVDVRERTGAMRSCSTAAERGRRPQPSVAASRALMPELAAEWDRQGEAIDPADMPLTRLVNSAIDGVALTMAETRADIARYAGADLLCYRAEEPETLAERQRWLSILSSPGPPSLGARFLLTAGLIHVAQPPAALAAIARARSTRTTILWRSPPSAP